MEYVNYPSLGYYITAVNGLQEDPVAQLYWGFGRRSLRSAGDCLFPVGKGSHSCIGASATAASHQPGTVCSRWVRALTLNN